MNWVLVNVKIPFLNNKKKEEDQEKIRKLKLQLLIMEEKKRAQEIINILNKSNPYTR